MGKVERPQSWNNNNDGSSRLSGTSCVLHTEKVIGNPHNNPTSWSPCSHLKDEETEQSVSVSCCRSTSSLWQSWNQIKVLIFELGSIWLPSLCSSYHVGQAKGAWCAQDWLEWMSLKYTERGGGIRSEQWLGPGPYFVWTWCEARSCER